MASGRLLVATEPVDSHDPDAWPSAIVAAGEWSIGEGRFGDIERTLWWDVGGDRFDSHSAAIDGRVLTVDWGGAAGRVHFLRAAPPGPLTREAFIGTFRSDRYLVDGIRVLTFFTFREDGTHFVEVGLRWVDNLPNTYPHVGGLVYVCASEGRWRFDGQTVTLEEESGVRVALPSRLAKGIFRDIVDGDGGPYLSTLFGVGNRDFAGKVCPETGAVRTSARLRDASTW